MKYEKKAKTATNPLKPVSTMLSSLTPSIGIARRWWLLQRFFVEKLKLPFRKCAGFQEATAVKGRSP